MPPRSTTRKEPTARRRAGSFEASKSLARETRTVQRQGKRQQHPSSPGKRPGAAGVTAARQGGRDLLRVACTRPASLQTSVRVYAISDPAQPHLVLAIAETLEAIAGELAPMPSHVVVYVSQDGHSHDLNATEQAELDEQVRARRLPSGEAA